MQKIDKTQILSTVYKQWEEDLEANNQPHPKYNSSNFRFYKDIVMNLFYCQKGLCAYTEKRLCNPEHSTVEHWKNGRYISDKPDIFGDLEHFDESLKAKKSDAQGLKDWLWNNFFMVDSNINTKVKGSKSVDSILKPDTESYNPYDLLDYNLQTHEFTCKMNGNLTDDEKQRIETMIEILGLNFGPILD
ncbi:MAG: hypothetical protein AB8G11_05465 [Saprospiraceae bacterium]